MVWKCRAERKSCRIGGWDAGEDEWVRYKEGTASGDGWGGKCKQSSSCSVFPVLAETVRPRPRSVALLLVFGHVGV